MSVCMTNPSSPALNTSFLFNNQLLEFEFAVKIVDKYPDTIIMPQKTPLKTHSMFRPYSIAAVSTEVLAIVKLGGGGAHPLFAAAALADLLQ